MAVLDEMYLVGKIVEVNFLTSRVLLLSDLNAKIPVTLEPGGIQAIMSGSGQQSGSLQYTKYSILDKSNENLLVFTSGAGEIFKSGIPIGKIKKEDQGEENKKVNFYSDFSQLKYVKVLSFSKEEQAITRSANEEIQQIDDQISEIKKDKETIKILLEQKKISQETRVKIEEENELLKKKKIILQNEIKLAKETIEQYEIKKEDIKFLELNLLYSSKCKKTFYNNLYKVGTAEYRNCVLNKGLINRN
jgi:rod shape-determining protein MreC